MLSLLRAEWTKVTKNYLYRFTPLYNVENARSWFVSQQAAPPVFPGFTAQPGLAYSLGLLTAWLVALLILSLLVFQRQDITS